MTNHERNVVNMFDEVIGVYDKNETILSAYPAIVECHGEFSTYVGKIKEVNVAYVQATPGKTEQKNNALEEVISAALPIKAALFSYAVRKNMQDLKAKASYSESDLKRLSLQDFITVVQIFEVEGRNNLADLAHYTITEEKLNSLSAKIAALKASKSEQGTGFTSRSALRKSLTEEFHKANETLRDHYDELIELVRPDHVQIYDEYIAARDIKDLGGSRPDDESDEPPDDGENK